MTGFTIRSLIGGKENIYRLISGLHKHTMADSIKRKSTHTNKTTSWIPPSQEAEVRESQVLGLHGQLSEALPVNVSSEVGLALECLFS